MARKTLEIDPRISNDRVGLMVTRGQVEHLGHAALKAQMLMDNSRNIIAFGSSQKSGEFDNPLTADQKRRAQLGVWGEAFKMVFLQDIGATDRSTDWTDYVHDRIETNQLPEPTDFYAGSLHEARWYEESFTLLKGAPDYVRGGFQVWENADTGKRIHILDRETNVQISASQVRTLIEQRKAAWRDFVPAKLWDFYDWEYPPHLRVAVELPHDIAAFPKDIPVGTKGIWAYDALKGNDRVFVFRDDGEWRPRTDAELTAKSMGD
jgi:nicotinamide mononucleotide adenylyltransferase